MLLMQMHAWPWCLVVVHTTALVEEDTLVIAEGNVAERCTRTAGQALEVGTMVSDRIDWVGRLAGFVQVLQMCQTAYLWGKGGEGQPCLVVESCQRIAD